MAVALTSMLVMNTLFNAMEQRLPIDANLKMIDIWLMHGLIMPFVVFLVLVISRIKSDRNIDKMSKDPESISSNFLQVERVGKHLTKAKGTQKMAYFITAYFFQ